jgi:cellulose synthase (UDP-forming)
MKHTNAVIPPSRKERFTLQFMILLGLAAMLFFLRYLINPNVIGYAPLYWMLIISIVFSCFKVAIEWVHYFYITVPHTPVAERVYSVDIFTTFCTGEPYGMIVETLTAIQAITYPHQAYLCDEANDPYLKDVCKKLGVHHITRVHKVNAKAGNINNALKQSSGEICVILDPDHIPVPEFLDPIIPHFNDPEIGYVQIVQAYRNHNHGLIAKGAAQQTFQFYGPIMMTMNKYGTVQAIGANCTFRRAALASIGGHAAGLAEDMHTAMQLHAAGWKSIYVPAVLARGLVPATLSAYYSQQLKWSRGVFELLVTSYPKLFKKLSWQQKIHYGVIPMHYLSGIIFLINFLIPVIALTFDVSPINIDLTKFIIAGFPLTIAMILIRHFVQWWVMEDEERGFHVVGGLLTIGTWWIYLVGLFYTIIRKKVPYIPTPKDEYEENNWHLSIPNFLIIGISLIAIGYGLYTDWSPYTLIMSCFALLNCFILLFTIVASRQLHFRKLKSKFGFVYNAYAYVSGFKKQFWKFRRRVYTGMRSTALLITVFTACLLLYAIKPDAETSTAKVLVLYTKNAFFMGIFAPQSPGGLTSVKLVKELESKTAKRFGIISLYLSWGDEPRCFLPFKTIDSVYRVGAFPLITWEPWQSLFNKTKSYKEADKEKKVFYRITQGYYDDYLNRFSQQVRSLGRPVYLRFAHEADNPSYPWSATGNNTPAEFKAAWQYVYNYFKRNRVYNVIWVWNPWKANAVDAYFPGKRYVDWIGVTCLNYGLNNPDKQWYSMEQLYNGFHENPVFNYGLPVMLTEFGSLPSEGRQDLWFKNAFKSIKTKYPEIKGVVLFNNGNDKNSIDKDHGGAYDWRISNLHTLVSLPNGNPASAVADKRLATLNVDNVKASDSSSNSLLTIKGINYTKGQNWHKAHHAFTKREMINDFAEIKRMGFNNIKWYGPGIYDHNILKAAKQQQLNITYGFWLPDDFSTGAYADRIIKTVNDLKEDDNIKAWNIGNTLLQKLSLSYFKPELFYQQDVYIRWLQKLVAQIKKADPIRPVTVDVYADNDLVQTTETLHRLIPEIDGFGLVTDEKSTGTEQIKQLIVPYFYSKIGATDYLKLPKPNTGVFISDWQDKQMEDLVTFDGLKDIYGRNKPEFYQLQARWEGLAVPQKLPVVKILVPAVTPFADTSLTYHAVILKSDKWEFAKTATNLEFKWELVKNNTYGQPIAMKYLGNSPDITFTMPENANSYKLYLYVSNGNQVEIIQQ